MYQQNQTDRKITQTKNTDTFTICSTSGLIKQIFPDT